MRLIKQLLAVSVLLVFSAFAFAQEFDNYKEIKSTGDIPKDFITLLSDKYKEDVEQIEKNTGYKSKKNQRQFYLESNYSINEIITSGNVLFNDPLTNYLNELSGKIVSANPSLKGKNIRFYTSKSTIINAFATHAGIILVNIGLLAKVETEDELVFIMCHEISHYIKQHNIKQYTYEKDIESEKGIFKRNDWETKMFSKANYSQKQELEADKTGFELFANTGYNIYSAMDALNCLKTYYIPFESNLVITGSLFESQNYKLPGVEVTPLDSISVREYKTDKELSTHPEIEARVSEINSLIENDKDKYGGLSTSVTKNRVQKTAQFEMCHLYLEKGMNIHALYSTFALLEDDNSNVYLNSILCKTLYALAQISSYNEFHFVNIESQYDEFRRDYKDEILYSSKEIQQIYQFINNLSSSQINTIAIAKIWDQRLLAPLSPEMEERLDGLFREKRSHFDTSTNLNVIIERDSLFAVLAEKEREKLSQTEDNESSDESRTLAKKKESKKIRRQKGIDKLLVVAPEFQKYDLRKKNSYKFEASEKSLLNYHDLIRLNAGKLKLKIAFLSPIRFQSQDVAYNNDLALISTFLYENSICTPNVISSKKEEINKLIREYETDKLALLGTISYHMDKTFAAKAGVLLWTGCVFPLLPYGLWYAITPKFETYNYTFVFDMKSEKLIFQNVKGIKMNSGESVINSYMYYNFMKLKNGTR